MQSGPMLSPRVQNTDLPAAASKSRAANLMQWPESSLSVLKSPCVRAPVCQVSNLFNLGLLSPGEHFKVSSGAVVETSLYPAPGSILTLPVLAQGPQATVLRVRGWDSARTVPLLSSFVLQLPQLQMSSLSPL